LFVIPAKAGIPLASSALPPRVGDLFEKFNQRVEALP